MSEEENKITTVEKTVKVKDPRKVELGKRLAKISKEAKLRKKQRLEMEAEREKNQIFNYIHFKYVVGGVTILGGLFGLYFAYKRDKREIKEEKLFEKEEKENKIIKTKQNKCNIENL